MDKCWFYNVNNNYVLAFSLKCIWQIFFICSIKSPQFTDKYRKKSFFHSDFPFPCFDVPKASNFTSGGVQNRETKSRGLGTIVTSIQDSKPREKQISPTFSYFLRTNALLYHFSANWLAHNKKMTEKSFQSQSAVFGVAVLYPTGSEIWRFWYIKTRWRKIAIEKIFLLHLSAHWEI